MYTMIALPILKRLKAEYGGYNVKVTICTPDNNIYYVNDIAYSANDDAMYLVYGSETHLLTVSELLSEIDDNMKIKLNRNIYAIHKDDISCPKKMLGFKTILEISNSCVYPDEPLRFCLNRQEKSKIAFNKKTGILSVCFLNSTELDISKSFEYCYEY